MWRWAKQTLATAVGTEEIYQGPEAIHPVASAAGDPVFSPVNRDDLKWRAHAYTCVETQTFYLLIPGGHVAMIQAIYSCLYGIHTVYQFVVKLFPAGKSPIFISNTLSNAAFTESRHGLRADGVHLQLSEDGSEFVIKFVSDFLPPPDVNGQVIDPVTGNVLEDPAAFKPRCVLNLRVRREAPGFMAGNDGITWYGTDQKAPSGTMRHALWPRISATGTITIPELGEVNFADSLGSFLHALQGMKPHHAAARWNFCTFQSPRISALMIEFTTPMAYAKTTVNVGVVARDGKLLTGSVAWSQPADALTDPALAAVSPGGAARTPLPPRYGGTAPDQQARHDKSEVDPDNQWPEPRAATFEWRGAAIGEDGLPAPDKGKVSASLHGDFGPRVDRIDIMAEVPRFVKQIIAGTAGTKPYIYQFSEKWPIEVKVQDGESEPTVEREEGRLFVEASFVA